MAALTFTAVLSVDGSLQVEPGFVVDAEPTPGDGPVEVVVLGERRRPIARTRLPAVPLCGPPVPGESAEPLGSLVLGVVDIPEEAAGIAVTIDGKQVWERDAPAEPLDVRVTWPRGLRRDRFELEWSAATADCAAVLAYSADAGSTWLPLSVPSTSQVIVADLTDAAGGDDCLLELFVTDGFASQRLRSPPYALEPAGWRVWIGSPADGAQVEATTVTRLSAQAFHLEERQASDDVSWSSSLDGALGSGARLPVSLSRGRHVLTATAREASASVAVDVR